MRKNVFILGTDDFNRRALESWQSDLGVNFYSILQKDEMLTDHGYPVRQNLQNARTRLREAMPAVDGILAYWDFPATLLSSLLSREFDLPGTDPQAVLKCEHKYWSRLEQAKVLEQVPKVYPIDPFDDQAREQAMLPYPFWLKPIKSCGSFLAFHVSNDEDFHHAIARIRQEIATIGDGFNYILDRIGVPREIAGIGGNHCLAEEEISGIQCTTEGYVFDRTAHTYAVIDSQVYPGTSSFLCYKYPSSLPDHVQQRLISNSNRLMEHLGFDHGAYNIEFFYDYDRDVIMPLEINPRPSQSHAHLLRNVLGTSNLEIATQLACGIRPKEPSYKGNFFYSAKFFMRCFTDGRIIAVPSEEDIGSLIARFPEAKVNVVVKAGDWLAHLALQDSYSYILCEIHLGADSEIDLFSKFQTCRSLLNFEIETAPTSKSAATRLSDREMGSHV